MTRPEPTPPPVLPPGTGPDAARAIVALMHEAAAMIAPAVPASFSHEAVQGAAYMLMVVDALMAADS